MANDLTITTIWAAITSILVVVLLASKWIEGVFGMKLFPAMKKGWGFFQRQWFKDAIFKKELSDWMEKIDNRFAVMQGQVDMVVYEVKPNGGKSMNDNVKATATDVREMKGVVLKNKAKREIADTYSPQMIFEMDSHGSCVFINDAFLRFFGWQEHDITEFGFEDLVHEEDVAEMRVKWQMAVNRKTKFYDEQRVKDSKGVYHKVCVKALPMLDEDILTGFYGQIELLEKI